jgi:hypothetical protein
MSMLMHSRAAVPALLALTGLSAACAQPAVSSAPASAASAPAMAYRSAFEGYRRFSDQAVSPWKASNDLVGRIGGWQAYAREAAGQDTPAPATAASAPAPAGHPGHHNHKTP